MAAFLLSKIKRYQFSDTVYEINIIQQLFQMFRQDQEIQADLQKMQP